MPVSKNILGMNARNFLYIRKYNFRSAKKRADDKLATKRRLIKNNISTPRLVTAFRKREDVLQYDWSQLPPDGFVIKPARGYGGGGIMVLHSWEENHGKTVEGETITSQELRSYLLDVLEGAYSLQFLPDKAFIEERVIPHPFFKKIAPIGIPDVRFIVFNKVPVMAMLRLPTAESGGKANLHQGAIGVGIDMRTGITTTAIHKDKVITRIPGTKIKTAGIKVPQWNELLLLAATTQSVSGLGYAGVDIVFDARLGPTILEVNARPGLSIQNANVTSLRTRLERVEHMPINTPERGVELAKSLFAEAFSEKVQISPTTLSVIEDISIIRNGFSTTVKAKVDSGAFRTSIDKSLADELGISERKEKVFVSSASGEGYRPTVNLMFEMKGRKISTIASVVDRSHLKYKMIVGRKDLRGFVIDPSTGDDEEQEEPEH